MTKKHKLLSSDGAIQVVSNFTDKLVAWHEKTNRPGKKSVSIETRRQVYKSALFFFSWMHHESVKLSSLDRDKYREYVRYLVDLSPNELASSTKQTYRTYSNLLMRYAFDKCGVKSFDLNFDFARRALKGKEDQRQSMLPSVNDILSLRSLAVPIHQAAFFEFLISSGVRIGEALQVRWCDITPKDRPIDQIAGTFSKFAGASVSLNAQVMNIKNSVNRKTYISRLAYRMLTIYAKVNEAPMDSMVPVFPWTKSSVDNWINSVNAKLTFESVSAINNNTLQKEEVLKAEAEDLSSLPADLRLLVMRRRKEGMANDKLKKKFQKQKGEVVTRPQKMHLSWHSFRHFFACCQLFRDYRGGRGDVKFVSQMLGHKTMDITNGYLRLATMVEDDQTWARIYSGTSIDWRSVSSARVSLIGGRA